MSESTNDKARKKQRIMVGSLFGGLLVLAVGGLIVIGPSKPVVTPEKVRESNIGAPGGKQDEQELWRSQSEGVLRNLNERLSHMETANQSKDARIAELESQVKDADKAARALPVKVDGDTGLLKKELPVGGMKSPPPPSGDLDGTTPTTGVPVIPVRQLVSVGQSSTRQAAGQQHANASDAARQGGSVADRPFLTSSSFVRAVNLTGLDAPTGGQAQGDPVPVFFRLTDVASLPNRYRTQVKECRVLGFGYGDLSSERAIVKLETLSCLLKNGKYLDATVKGGVIGEDGKYGMRGRLVTKQGQMIANGIMAGLASGIGKGFSNQLGTVSTGAAGTVATFNGDDIWKSGVGQGIGGGMDMLASYFIKAAEKLFPVIEVDSARTVDLAFTRPLTIGGIQEHEYSALVKRNRKVNQ